MGQVLLQSALITATNRVPVVFVGTGKQDTAPFLHQLYAAANNAPPADVAVELLPLDLDNRYYSATLQLHLVRGTDSLTAEATSSLLAGADGVVIVVDGDAAATGVEALRRLHIEPDDAGVALCLVTGTVGSSLTELEELCLDRGIELVELDARDDSMESLGRELCGMDRVIEALSTHTWKNMKMKPRTRAVVLEAREDADDEPIGDHTTEDPAARRADPAALGASTNGSAGARDGPIDMSALLTGLAAMNGDEEEDDDVSAAFENALRAMQNMRESSRTLSDDERRRRAAEVALSIWHQLGGSDDDEDGEDSA